MADDSSSAMISARQVLRVLELCRAQGHDPEGVCRDVGIHMAQLAEPEARVPYTLVERMGMRALELTGDDDFGLHLAASVRDSANFDVGMLVLMASPTVRVALEKFVANQRYWGDGERASLHPTETGMAVRYVLPGATGVYARHAVECALAEIAVGVRMLTGAVVNPTVVRFPHRAPPSTDEHRRVFECALQFASPHAEAVFDDAALDTRMQHANDTFLAIFERQLETALARLPAVARASDSVKAVARTALAAGSCTLTQTARSLGLSPRTLQRRLQDEGTSFADLIDALRRELAEAYLRRGLAIGDVAGLLGYADATAFHHAFRRWTGLSPARFTSDPESES